MFKMFNKIIVNKVNIYGFLLLLCVMCSFTYCKNYEDDVVLSIHQKKLLDEFRNRVIHRLPHEYMKEDIYLIKWLRNREFDLQAAERSLMNNLRWREEQKMDTIHDEDWSDMSETFKYYLEGRDKFGRSILFIDVWNMDVRKAVIQGQGNRLNRYADKAIDEGCTLTRELGKKYKNITRGHLVINADRFSIIQHACVRCMPFLLNIVTSYENHYPECADQVLVLNAPSAIEALVNAVIPLLSRETKESLRIYGKNQKVWKGIMSKVFDFDQLPPAIGGTKIYKGMEEDYIY